MLYLSKSMLLKLALLIFACSPAIGSSAAEPAAAPIAGTPAPISPTAESSTNSGTANIPVLCYHRFGKYGAKDEYSVEIKEFKRQLEIIREEGFTPITASQLFLGWEGKSALPDKSLLITVDDGYKDFRRQAEKLLIQAGYRATLFIYPGFINSKLGLPEAALAELQKEGFEIGSHSYTHPKLTKRPAGETTAARQKRLTRELQASRKKLRAWSGGEVISLAYPYGLWDQDSAEVARTAGYQLMFTVNPGTNTVSTPREALKRILVLRGMRDATLRQMLRQKELPVANWNPALGERVQGPIAQVSLTLEPGFLGRLDPKSLHAKRGETKLNTVLNPQTGQVDISFPQPWNHGTDLIILMAHAQEEKATYIQSWLVIVDPAQTQKGK